MAVHEIEQRGRIVEIDARSNPPAVHDREGDGGSAALPAAGDDFAQRVLDHARQGAIGVRRQLLGVGEQPGIKPYRRSLHASEHTMQT